MDENVQLPSNLLSRLKKAAEAVDKASKVRVISHNDADGLGSAGVICSFLQRSCKEFHCTMAKGFDEKLVRDNIESYDLLIISDMGSNNLMALESLPIPVIVLDHHKPERDSEKVIHCNPHLVGIDGATSGCASSVALALATVISEANWDLAWVAFGGIVGDRQHMRGLSGINVYLFQQAQRRKMIEERPPQLITDGPLKEALYQSTEPFIVGVSGDQKGVAQLLADAGVMDNLPYESVEERRQMKLNSLISLQLLQQGCTMANLEEVLCPRFYSPEKKLFCKDLANALNACGKSEKQGLGLAMLMGDKVAKDNAWKMKDDFGMELLKTSLEVQRKGLLQGQHIQYFISPSQDVSSEACGVMMQWVGDQNKPTISLTHKGGEVRISSRANQHIVNDLGVDLGAALRAATGKVGGNGGGHNVASGGRIPFGKEEEFIRELDRIIGEQKALKEANFSAK
ncbi:MAG: DHH family protein [Methanomassiliicoccales archaeon PtaU1.Bin124]|nr:MAG: DHH family protein [Methanomassiliicoccales archaeon PtaU1.Bin124]